MFNLLKPCRGRGSSICFTSFSVHKRCLKDHLQYCAATEQVFSPQGGRAQLPRSISSRVGTWLAPASFSHHLHHIRLRSAHSKERLHGAASGTRWRYGRRERSGCFCEDLAWARLQQKGGDNCHPRAAGSTKIKELQKEVGAVGLDPLGRRRDLNLGNLLSGWDFKAGTAPPLPLTRPEEWFYTHPWRGASQWLSRGLSAPVGPWLPSPSSASPRTLRARGCLRGAALGVLQRAPSAPSSRLLSPPLKGNSTSLNKVFWRQNTWKPKAIRSRKPTAFVRRVDGETQRPGAPYAGAEARPGSEQGCQKGFAHMVKQPWSSQPQRALSPQS